jgi:FixJ family two-component response regulator
MPHQATRVMTEEKTIVHVVDDDEAVRGALSRLLRSVGYGIRSHGTASEFLKAQLPDAPGCIVLDVRLPGVSGLELQEHLNRTAVSLPLVLISGHGDIPMSVRAMKAGAVDFLTKPFRDQDMLDAVGSAVEIHRTRLNHAPRLAALLKRHDRLSPREKQVMTLACAGNQNRQIAADLGIQVITVKVHRSNVMKKMEASSLAELARMSQILEPDERELYRGIGGP